MDDRVIMIGRERTLDLLIQDLNKDIFMFMYAQQCMLAYAVIPWLTTNMHCECIFQDTSVLKLKFKRYQSLDCKFGFLYTDNATRASGWLKVESGEFCGLRLLAFLLLRLQTNLFYVDDHKVMVNGQL